MKSIKLTVQLFALFVFILVVTACSSGNNAPSGTEVSETETKGEQETIVLKGLTAWEETNIHSAGFKLFKEKIEEKSNGRVEIKYVGGPEAVPAFNQGDAIRNGTADFSIISTAYFASNFPESIVLNYSELTPAEERESGALDYLNEIAKERMNGIILGRGTEMEYSLYLREPITSIEEIAKKRVRASSTYIPFLEAMGAEIVSMPGGEMYTALERGVIDGVGWPEAGVTDFGLEEQLAVKILPSYNKVDTVNIMNLDTYNSLPDDVKQLLTEVMIEVESEVGSVVKDYMEKEAETLKAAGVEIVTISEEDQYLETAVNASWEWMHENVENTDKLSELFRK